MDINYAIKGENLSKNFKEFKLNIPSLKVPEGFATALIGENGAGKTTLLNMLSGIRLDYKGNIKYFDKYSDDDRENNPIVKERIGYTGTGNYYFPKWTIKDIEEINKMLFKDFSSEQFHKYCEELAISSNGSHKKISELSDGTKTKLMLAGVMARKTNLLILDEPASPLDPLMREKLCDIIGNYINDGNGKNSVLFSTHNISDMESITDYAIIMEHGEIVEEGFVEELKEKYILVKGDKGDIEEAEKVLYTINTNPYGFEGICLSENIDKLIGMNIVKEIPSLFQISVAVMKNSTKLVIR